ncbi:hypothetical protein ACIP93_32635 [Streptomyces sp. NPDC088745]
MPDNTNSQQDQQDTTPSSSDAVVMGDTSNSITGGLHTEPLVFGDLTQ